jgi:hypothetical protein
MASKTDINDSSAFEVRGRSAERHSKNRESIHMMQKLEVDSNISQNAIRLYSGLTRHRLVPQAREVVLSHRHD